MTMIIAVGADHAGLELKDYLAGLLTELGHTVIDKGTNSSDSCDYPVFAQAVCREVLDGGAERGLLVCGTGIGMAVAANRFKGIRAANVGEPLGAALSRAHNNSNVLTLGGRMIGRGMAEEILRTWLQTPYEGARHQRRLDLMDQ